VFLKSNHIGYVFCGREERALYSCKPERFIKLYADTQIAILKLENSK